VTWRFTGAAIGMFAFAAFKRLPLVLDRRGLIVAAVMGCSVFSLNFQFVYRSEQVVTSGLVAVLFALLLVPNTVLSRIFLGQRITRGFPLGTAHRAKPNRAPHATNIAWRWRRTPRWASMC
jgi:drug/metabolite transporter (DMT)-like permease